MDTSESIPWFIGAGGAGLVGLVTVAALKHIRDNEDDWYDGGMNAVHTNDDGMFVEVKRFSKPNLTTGAIYPRVPVTGDYIEMDNYPHRVEVVNLKTTPDWPEVFINKLSATDMSTASKIGVGLAALAGVGVGAYFLFGPSKARSRMPRMPAVLNGQYVDSHKRPIAIGTTTEGGAWAWAGSGWVPGPGRGLAPTGTTQLSTSAALPPAVAVPAAAPAIASTPQAPTSLPGALSNSLPIGQIGQILGNAIPGGAGNMGGLLNQGAQGLGSTFGNLGNQASGLLSGQGGQGALGNVIGGITGGDSNSNSIQGLDFGNMVGS